MPTEDVGSWRFADGRKDRSRAGWSWKRLQSMLAADWTAGLFFSAGHVGGETPCKMARAGTASRG